MYYIFFGVWLIYSIFFGGVNTNIFWGMADIQYIFWGVNTTVLSTSFIKSFFAWRNEAIIKMHLLTGTYLLLIHQKKFNLKGVVDACCPLCCMEDEDLVHMLTRCPALSETRIIHLNDIKQCVWDELGPLAWKNRIVDASILVQLIMDWQKLVQHKMILYQTINLCHVLLKWRHGCFAINYTWKD